MNCAKFHASQPKVVAKKRGFEASRPRNIWRSVVAVSILFAKNCSGFHSSLGKRAMSLILPSLAFIMMIYIHTYYTGEEHAFVCVMNKTAINLQHSTTIIQQVNHKSDICY